MQQHLKQKSSDEISDDFCFTIARLKVQFLLEFYFDFIPYGNCAFAQLFCCFV